MEDREADQAAGRFNPLEATGTDDDAARRLAEALVTDVQQALERVALVDPALARVLLGKELTAAVHRVLPPPVPAQRASSAGPSSSILALWMLLSSNMVFVGGSWGGGRRRRHRGYPPPGYGSQGHAGYGYRRVGPSCGQLCACNCCANLACNACCCGSQCSNG